MSPPPAAPSVFHITHVQNLGGIVAAGGLWSDAAMIRSSATPTTIGMSKLKQRRLTLPMRAHPGTFVGDYVPFYFAPRSVMLYLLHKGNHPDVSYTGGQRPIVHLEADLGAVVAHAQASGQRWGFSLSNASAYLAQFRADVAHLHEIDWAAVRATLWSGCTEPKQAEFLLHDFFPWTLVRRIGVLDAGMQASVQQAIAGAAHRPPVAIEPSWYY